MSDKLFTLSSTIIALLLLHKKGFAGAEGICYVGIEPQWGAYARVLVSRVSLLRVLIFWVMTDHVV
jgi:hypothetical protein